MEEVSKDFAQYFATFWKPREAEWARHAQSDALLLGMTTNNALEGMHRAYKRKLNAKSTLASMITKLCTLCDDNVGESKNAEVIIARSRQPLVGVDHDLWNLLNQFVPKVNKHLVKELMAETDDSHVPSLSGPTCTCPFFHNWNLPCRHLRDIFRDNMRPLEQLADGSMWKIDVRLQSRPSTGAPNMQHPVAFDKLRQMSAPSTSSSSDDTSRTPDEFMRRVSKAFNGMRSYAMSTTGVELGKIEENIVNFIRSQFTTTIAPDDVEGIQKPLKNSLKVSPLKWKHLVAHSYNIYFYRSEIF